MTPRAKTKELRLSLSPVDNRRLANLCGHLDENIKHIEAAFGVNIANRGGAFRIGGPATAASAAKDLLKSLYETTSRAHALTPAEINIAMKRDGAGNERSGGHAELRTPKCTIQARTPKQAEYIERILSHDISFGVGPAGTGKTYLAVACAVDALERDRVSRIVLVRPAVEAGERLGFLPGDLGQKVDPYLRPLYDALHEMLGTERVARLLEKQIIELAPLAYMRGRTLNESFIILDEAQNTTVEQMKMFLTRLGFGSTAVITGDVTQVDLPRSTRSGLRHALDVLAGVNGIAFAYFGAEDVVRHPLVQRIVEAYAADGQPGESR